MYQERPSTIAGAMVWTRTTAAECRVVPDGCMDLMWHGEQLVVAGPDTQAHVSPATGMPRTGLRFAPGTGPAFLGVPAHELRNLRVPLDAMWASGEVKWLAERMQAAPHPGRMLETAGEERLRDAAPPWAAAATVIAALNRGDRVTEVAAALGISDRQLRRRCLDSFGYPPKTLDRVLRMIRSLALPARAGVPFAEVAVRAGYADQPHLARDVKALAGVTLTSITA